MYLLALVQKSHDPIEVLHQTRQRYEIKAEAGSTRFQLEMRSQKFAPSRHRIKWIKASANSSRYLVLDGRKTLGGIDIYPHSELGSFKLRINGRQIRVPRGLWADLCDPHLEFHYTEAKLVPRSGLLRIRNFGADGYAGYGVIWTIAKSGKVDRKLISGEDLDSPWQ